MTTLFERERDIAQGRIAVASLQRVKTILANEAIRIALVNRAHVNMSRFIAEMQEQEGRHSLAHIDVTQFMALGFSRTIRHDSISWRIPLWAYPFLCTRDIVLHTESNTLSTVGNIMPSDLKNATGGILGYGYIAADYANNSFVYDPSTQEVNPGSNVLTNKGRQLNLED